MYFTEKQDKKRQSIHRIIVSLMNGVRLHPYLIFHTKEWEASSQRSLYLLSSSSSASDTKAKQTLPSSSTTSGK